MQKKKKTQNLKKCKRKTETNRKEKNQQNQPKVLRLKDSKQQNEKPWSNNQPHGEGEKQILVQPKMYIKNTCIYL